MTALATALAVAAGVCLGASPVRADGSGAVVVAAFTSEDPELGLRAMRILHLQIWKTLRKPAPESPKRTAYYDPYRRPTSQAEAEKVASVSGAPMTVWGQAWDYKPGLAIQAYLSISPDGSAAESGAPIWTVTFPGARSIGVRLPTSRYEFAPMTVDRATAQVANDFSEIPTFAEKGSHQPVGVLGDSFQAQEQDREWTRVLAAGQVRWVHLPRLSETQAEVVNFVGGLIRVRRGDAKGALDLLGRVVRNPRARTGIRSAAYLLMAAAASQPGAPDRTQALSYTDEARGIAPLDPAPIKFACMAHFAAFARGDGAGHLTAARELLATNRDVFSPDDSWVRKANGLLADLSPSPAVSR
jgi:hypothetical protein